MFFYENIKYKLHNANGIIKQRIHKHFTDFNPKVLEVRTSLTCLTYYDKVHVLKSENPKIIGDGNSYYHIIAN